MRITIEMYFIIEKSSIIVNKLIPIVSIIEIKEN